MFSSLCVKRAGSSSLVNIHKKWSESTETLTIIAYSVCTKYERHFGSNPEARRIVRVACFGKNWPPFSHSSGPPLLPEESRGGGLVNIHGVHSTTN